MQKISLILFVSAFIGNCSYEGKRKIPDPLKPSKDRLITSTKIERLDSVLNFDYPPFILYTDIKDSTYLVRADLNSSDYNDPYTKLFKEYEFSGKGYSWECLIRQILNKENKQLLSRGEISSLTENFYFWADSKESQRQFAVFVSQKFRDRNILKDYLKTAKKCAEEQ
jgi:hypothetical protein